MTGYHYGKTGRTEDFWYPAELEVLGLPPTATRGGELLFLSGQTGIDFTSGKVRESIWELPGEFTDGYITGFEHRDGREGPMQAQAIQIYRNLQEILDHLGSSRESIVRQRLYVRDLNDIPALEKVIRTTFGGHPPATNILQSAGVGADPKIKVSAEVIALVDGGIRAERLEVAKEGLNVSWGYPRGTLAGGLCFTSGLQGVVEAGRLARSRTDAPRRWQEVFFGQDLLTAMADEPLKAQLSVALSSLEETFERLGVTNSSLLRQNFFTSAGMNEWGAAAITPRGDLFQEPGLPTVTALSIPGINAAESRVALDAIVALPGVKIDRHAGEDLAMSQLDMAVAAGPYVFTTGYVGMDKSLHRALNGPEDLRDDAGRLLRAGSWDDLAVVRAQAWHTYRNMKEILSEMDVAATDILQQTLFLRDFRYLSEVRHIARAVFDGREPPTSVVGVSDIGPYPGLLFEVDFVALRAH